MATIERAKLDQNRKPTIAGVSSIDNEEVWPVLIDPVSGGVVVSPISGAVSGSVSISDGTDTAEVTGDGDLQVTLAGEPVTVTGTVDVQEVQPGTATLSNVSASATSVTLIAANTDRRGFFIYNDSSVDLYVKFGSAASTTSFTVKISPQFFYELPNPLYTGIVTGVWSNSTGTARVTEIT